MTLTHYNLKFHNQTSQWLTKLQPFQLNSAIASPTCPDSTWPEIYAIWSSNLIRVRGTIEQGIQAAEAFRRGPYQSKVGHEAEMEILKDSRLKKWEGEIHKNQGSKGSGAYGLFGDDAELTAWVPAAAGELERGVARGHAAAQDHVHERAPHPVPSAPS